ncbi:MAG: hypothetical protein RLZZ76_557, partial [Candidatus Parcubacteria bacterium]
IAIRTGVWCVAEIDSSENGDDAEGFEEEGGW